MSASFKTLSPEIRFRVAPVSTGRPFRAATRKVVAMAGTKKVDTCVKFINTQNSWLTLLALGIPKMLPFDDEKK